MRIFRSRVNTESVLSQCIRLLFLTMMVIIMGACLFLTHIAYACKQYTESNWVLLGSAVLGAGVMVPMICFGVRKYGRYLDKWFIPISIVAFFIQVFMTAQYYFYTGWDVEVIVASALSGVNGSSIEQHATYYSMYPNNLVLVTLFSWIARFVSAIGLPEYAYFSLLVFQCLICCVTGIILHYLVRYFSGNRFSAWIASVLYMLLIGLSPWVSIPYSDSVVLFFPTAILAVYFMMRRDGLLGMLRQLLIVVLSYLGYRIKPQAMVVLIAIVCYEIGSLLVLGNMKRKMGIKKVVNHVVLNAAGLAAAALICNAMAGDVKVDIDENKAFGPSHFLMMGMNTETFGVYYQNDISLSWRMPTREERLKANLTVTAERIKDMGPIGLAKQLIRKTLTNYNDGSYCWGGEGGFFREILSERHSIVSPFLRQVYYNPYLAQGYGQYNAVWMNTVQAIWMLVLALALCCAVFVKEERLAVVMLSLIGITLFEMLFEARARYLYCYAPVYILMASIGLNRVRAWAADRILR